MSRTPRLEARIRMSSLASRMSVIREDRVAYADARTSMDDLRAALSIAIGQCCDRRGYRTPSDIADWCLL